MILGYLSLFWLCVRSYRFREIKVQVLTFIGKVILFSYGHQGSDWVYCNFIVETFIFGESHDLLYK
ncbi:MAG TPA: hypothetical protein DC057_05415 [Spirochaetia bacterium]|nr:hypothetical protein [Spirochaetia bacterium]